MCRRCILCHHEDIHRKHVVNKGNVINAFNVMSEETDKWCFDSGATSHMYKDRNRFVDLQKVINQKVRLANDKLTDIKGIGTVYLLLAEGTRTHRIKLKNTLYVPELSTNLFSASKATTNGHKILLTEKAATILNQGGNKILTAKKNKGLYFLETISDFADSAILNVGQMELWHQRYGHLNIFDLKRLSSEKLVLGTPEFSQQNFSCKVCVQNKQTANPFLRQSDTKCRRLLEIVSSDVCGPMKTKSIGG